MPKRKYKAQSRNTFQHRLATEMEELRKEAAPGCSAGPIGDDITKWQGMITGPEKSPYESGFFFLDIEFPEGYPFSPPRIKFKTKIYHPNIDPSTGVICLDILTPGCWSPSLTISKVLLSIVSLLTDPNPHVPAPGSPSYMYVYDRESFDRTAKEWTHRYASSRTG